MNHNHAFACNCVTTEQPKLARRNFMLSSAFLDVGALAGCKPGNVVSKSAEDSDKTKSRATNLHQLTRLGGNTARSWYRRYFQQPDHW